MTGIPKKKENSAATPLEQPSTIAPKNGRTGTGSSRNQGKKLEQTNKKSCFSGNMTNFGNGWVSCNRAVFQNNEQHTINDQCSCYYICVIQMSFHPVIK